MWISRFKQLRKKQTSIRGIAMKKLLIGLLIILFCMTIVSPVYAGHPLPRYHYPYWTGIGLGILAGTIVTGLFYRPPPPQAFIVRPSRPIVVQPVPSPVVSQSLYMSIQPIATADKPVSVTAQLLNVRSGPGMNFSVISNVYQGSILTIKGSAPDWFYVKLPNGNFGWVMAQFTDQTSLSTSG